MGKWKKNDVEYVDKYGFQPSLSYIVYIDSEVLDTKPRSAPLTNWLNAKQR